MPSKDRKQINRAVSDLKSGNWKAANKKLDVAYKLVPSNSEVNFLLGYLFFQTKKFDEARSSVDKAIAAHLLEADAGDIEVVPGRASASPARRPARSRGPSWPRPRRTRRARRRASTAAWRRENDFETPDATYPFGTHLAVVEVDPETGLAHLVRHITVDDSGRIHNEKLLEGQVHGGIAQGVAQALFEEIALDEDGNNVTGSLASYAIPSAGGPAELRDRAHADAVAAQPAGGQGHRRVRRDRLHAGGLERGRRRARALGVRNIDMPATPQRVWQAISAAG